MIMYRQLLTWRCGIEQRCIIVSLPLNGRAEIRISDANHIVNQPKSTAQQIPAWKIRVIALQMNELNEPTAKRLYPTVPPYQRAFSQGFSICALFLHFVPYVGSIQTTESISIACAPVHVCSLLGATTRNPMHAFCSTPARPFSSFLAVLHIFGICTDKLNGHWTMPTHRFGPLQKYVNCNWVPWNC